MEFGTDGFRGKARDFSDEGLRRIGYELAKNGLIGQIVLGYDTRESSSRFRKNIINGINKGGGEVIDLGIVPTPTVSYFSKVIGSAKYGIMLTASHNPYYDNGIKVFNSGNKISSEFEKKLQEAYFNDNLNIGSTREEKFISRDPINYLKYVSSKFNLENLGEKKIVIDTANGAASFLAKKLFSQENFLFVSDKPNGKNINYDCGIISPENIGNKVIENNAYFGVTYDGDCDRIGLCDEIGNFIDGDYLLAFLTKDMLKKGQLKNNTLVVTEYSNLALDSYIESFGGRVVRVPNGDKSVFAKMRELDASFGGEKLGHIIFSAEFGTGDGLLSTKEILSRLDYSKSISEQMRSFDLNPQIILNVPVTKKVPISQIDGLENTIQRVKKELNGSGRLLIRPSGTEDVYRIMVEGRDKIAINQMAKEIGRKFDGI